MTVPSPSAGGPATTTPGGARQRLGRRRALPSGRAVTGALLITLAFIGTLVLTRRADAGPTTRFVVATRPVAPGERLSADAVALTELALPAPQAEVAFDALPDVLDATALGPLAPGELVQRSAVRRPGDGPSTSGPQLTVALERARALGGRLQVGEPVDVLATYGTGEVATTLVLARGATVVAVDAPRTGVGSSGAVLVTLTLPGVDAALATAHAGEVGALTLVRPAPSGTAPGVDRYRAPTGDTGDRER